MSPGIWFHDIHHHHQFILWFHILISYKILWWWIHMQQFMTYKFRYVLCLWRILWNSTWNMGTKVPDGSLWPLSMGLQQNLKNFGPGPGCHSLNYQVWCMGARSLPTGQDRNLTQPTRTQPTESAGTPSQWLSESKSNCQCTMAAGAG